jgi:nuclear transport factor 2 (NTF2) superfamily protein
MKLKNRYSETTDEQETKKLPFTKEAALARVQTIQSLWNSCDPGKVVEMFDDAAQLLNRGNVIQGKPTILSFLRLRLERELHCNMRMELWSFTEVRTSASFQSEWQDALREQWYRTEGNMQMCFNDRGLIIKLSVSAYDIQIAEAERKFRTTT